MGKQKGGGIVSQTDASHEGEDDKKCKPNLEIGISDSHYLTNMDI